MELPDWLRGIVLLGRDGAEYRVVGVDADGYLGVILQAAAEVTVPGGVNVTQEDSIREMQGKEGVTLRTVAVDANGQIIMVPRGSTGNYLAVDANGYMGAILKATADVAVTGTAAVTQEDSIREMQGKEGVTLRTVAVDANGQIIMVPRGNTGNYMSVSASGFLSAVIRGEKADTTSKTVAVDDDGQIIMVPRGATGNYLGVDASGYMTTVIKGTYGAVLKTLAADNEGYLVAILKDSSDQWGKKISVGLAELAARLGSPVSWDRRGQVVQVITFEDGLGHCAVSASGTGALAELNPGVFQTGGYSCKLKTGTTVNKSASITTYGDFSPSGRLGFEFTFSMADQPDYVYALGRVWNGAVETRAYMRWIKSTNKLQILNSGNTYEDVCAFQLPAVPNLFVSVKVVCDVSQQEWVRLLSRGVEYDLSGTFLYQTASATHPYLTYQIQAKEDAAVSHTIYLDRMIVTTDEP